MTKPNMQNRPEAASTALLDLSNLKSSDSATLEIVHPVTGAPLGWKWEIAGPGHAQTLALQDKWARERQKLERQKEQCRINGRKWKGDEKTPEDTRRENAANITARVIGFTPVMLNGEKIDFSPDACNELFLNQEYGWVFTQVIDFLNTDDAFFRISVKN